jgi:hypothetical protein
MIESIDDLIVFLKHFHRHLLEDPSLPPEQIPDDLPEGLAKIYRELGGLIDLEYPHPRPFATQDTLVSVKDLERVDEKIEFAWENQGNWIVRCPSNQKDPPVYSNADDVWEDGQKGFVVVCESLNHFLITLCLQEAVMGSINFASTWTDNILEKTIAAGNFQPLWLNGHYVFNEPSHNFYISQDRDILIMDRQGEGIWIGSQTRTVRNIFPPDIDFEIMEELNQGMKNESQLI